MTDDQAPASEGAKALDLREVERPPEVVPDRRRLGDAMNEHGGHAPTLGGTGHRSRQVFGTILKSSPLVIAVGTYSCAVVPVSDLTGLKVESAFPLNITLVKLTDVNFG